MKLINQSVELIDEIDGVSILKKLEQIGRVCYKSEDKITDDSYIQFITNILKRGHEAIIEHEHITIKWITDRGCCYDKDTKVLTKAGFKYFYDLVDTDEYYTLNDDNELELIKAANIIKYKYNGELDHYHTTQIDLMVTPNHNMWVYDYNKRSTNSRVWKFIESRNMTNNRYMFYKSCCPIINEEDSKIVIPGYKNISRNYLDVEYNTNLFFELLGIILTDGSISYGKNGSGNRLSITQIKKSGRARIEHILKFLNIPHTIYETEYRLKQPQLLKWIADNFLEDGNTRKTYYLSLPEWIFNISYSAKKSLLNGIILGDGTKHTRGPGFQIYTASAQFAEDLVRLSLTIGNAANIYEVPERKRIFPFTKKESLCKRQYVVSIVETTTHLYNKKISTFNRCTYNDYVYCVELPKYHRLYIMRNGKSCWCGNSHELVRHRLANYAQESTRYVNYAGKDMEFINPVDFKFSTADKYDLIDIEAKYKSMIKDGKTPQQARAILPNCLKTEIIFTMNLRELRHMLTLRCSKSAHPSMQDISIKTLKLLSDRIPLIFDDLVKEYLNG